MKIKTPHDRFFKETFGKIEVTKDFLENYLPESIIKVVDMNTLEPQKDSFIDKEFKEIFADMMQKLDTETLEIIVDDIFSYEKLDDLDKFIK